MNSRILSLLFVLAVVELGVGCCTLFNSCKSPDPVIIASGGSTSVGGSSAGVGGSVSLSDQCERACSVLDGLKCQGAQIDSVAHCAQACVNAESSGTGRFCPVDLAKITECSQLTGAFEACDVP
jgi:hypothetical protein